MRHAISSVLVSSGIFSEFCFADVLSHENSGDGKPVVRDGLVLYA